MGAMSTAAAPAAACSTKLAAQQHSVNNYKQALLCSVSPSSCPSTQPPNQRKNRRYTYFPPSSPFHALVTSCLPSLSPLATFCPHPGLSPSPPQQKLNTTNHEKKKTKQRKHSLQDYSRRHIVAARWLGEAPLPPATTALKTGIMALLPVAVAAVTLAFPP